MQHSKITQTYHSKAVNTITVLKFQLIEIVVLRMRTDQHLPLVLQTEQHLSNM